MIPLLIFIAALVIIGFITFLFVYNFRTPKSEIPPVPPEFNDDFSREFNGSIKEKNGINVNVLKGRYSNNNGIMLYEYIDNPQSTIFDDTVNNWPTGGNIDNDTADFGGGGFGGGGAGGSYDDSGSSGSSDYSSDSGSSDSGSSYD